MIFDLAGNFDLLALEGLRRELILLELRDRRRKDDRGKRRARRAEIDEIGIAARRFADAKNAAADARLAAGERPDLVDLASLHNLRLWGGRHRVGRSRRRALAGRRLRR